MTANEGHFRFHSFTFSSDSRWVLCQGEGTDGEGLCLAPVELPQRESQ